ncbi:MAG: amidase family protein [candidate division KSB1 bacterium]|nr:amidase family protein [candidate division KSB1 bacterium]
MGKIRQAAQRDTGILIGEVPHEVIEDLERCGVRPGEVRVAVRSDLDLRGQSVASWLVITSESVVTVTPSAPLGERLVGPFPLRDIRTVRVFTGVGSSFLQAYIQSFFVDLIRFSNARREEFNRALIFLERLVEQQPAAVEIFRKKHPWFCELCGLALPSQYAVCPRCARQGGLLRRTLRMMSPYRLFVLLLLLMMLAGVALDLVPPYLTRILVDDVLTTKVRISWLPWLVLGLAATTLVRAGLNIAIGRTSTQIGTRITYELRRQLQRKLSELSVDFYDRTSVGTLMTRLLHDVDYFHGFVQQVASGFMVNIFLVAGIGFMLFSLNARLALFVLIPVPFVVLGTWFFWHTIYPRYYRFWDSQSKLAALLNGMLSGIRTVKAFAQERREQKRFDGVAAYLRDSRRAVDRGSATFFPVFGYAFSLGGLIVWLAGGRSVIGGQITLGTLMAFFGYLGMFYGPISALTMFSNWLTGFLTAGQRIFEVLDADVTLRPPAHPRRVRAIRGRIEFRNVTFGYDPYDPFSVQKTVPNYQRGLGKDLKGIRIGVPKEYYFDHLEADVQKAVSQAIKDLKKLGVQILSISIPHLPEFSSAAFISLLAEGAACLEKWHKTRAVDLGKDVLGRLNLGVAIKATQYLQAQRIRRIAQKIFREVFNKVDALITPQLPIVAPLIGQETISIGDFSEGVASALTRFTRIFNLIGLPTMSIPCGFSSTGLPIGLQIVGQAFDEGGILRIGYAYQMNTSWHNRKPNID